MSDHTSTDQQEHGAPGDEVTVEFDEGRQAYVAVLGGDQVGVLVAQVEEDGVVLMPHTVVDDAAEGRGVGSALARHALDAARDAGRRVRPTCPFVASWIERHPAYADLVAG